jgi:hypothetical protein
VKVRLENDRITVKIKQMELNKITERFNLPYEEKSSP